VKAQSLAAKTLFLWIKPHIGGNVVDNKEISKKPLALLR
jgi:hypothetical protein